MTGDTQISVAPQQDWRQALTLVLRSLPADQRGPLVDSLAKLRQEPLAPFQALVIARENGKLVAACWGQPQPGRSCSLWAPQAERGEVDRGLAQAMVSRVVEIADSAGIAVCQTLAETSHGSMHECLEQNAFRRVAELQYLQWRPQQHFPAIARPEVEFQPYNPRQPKRLERVISETYVDTLDFPELDGMRDLKDVLRGYQYLGEFRAELWSYLVIDGQDAGVLLLAEYPDTQQLELVYMGVAPWARGRGLGAAAVSHGQHQALQLGVQRMVLAVDLRNHVAEAIYKRAGFRSWARRFAYLRAAFAKSPAG